MTSFVFSALKSVISFANCRRRELILPPECLIECIRRGEAALFCNIRNIQICRSQQLHRMIQTQFFHILCIDKSITKFNKFSPDFLCILAQHKQAVKFCFLAASFIRSVLPILSSRPAFPAMRSLSYIMVTLLFVMRSAPVPAGIGGTWSPHSYTRESSEGSC